MVSVARGFDDGTAVQDGTATLGWASTKLLRLLDSVFADWAADAGALEISAAPLLTVRELATLDVYRNFPHLAMVAATLVPDKLSDSSPTELAPEVLQDARMALPSAVCYGFYLHLRGRALPEKTVLTAVGTCYRNEGYFDGLRRLQAFHMREIVALGHPEDIRQHLHRFTALILRFAETIGLEIRRETSNDPFFDPDAVEAMWQRFGPVKYEFCFKDLAIASTNEHRKFFGDRCAIMLDGAAVSTGCVAMGLERWVHALSERYGGDLDAACAAVEAGRAATVGGVTAD